MADSQTRALYWDVVRVLGKRKEVWKKMCRDLQKERMFRWLDSKVSRYPVLTGC